MTSEEWPLLSQTPCPLVYIKGCKCWQLQKYTHLNPEDPDGAHVKGSLDSLIGDGIPLNADNYHFGEVSIWVPLLIFLRFCNVLKMGMLTGGGILGWTGAPGKRMLGRHPVFNMNSALMVVVPPILGRSIPSNNIRFIEMRNINWYLEGLFREGEWCSDWPASYKVPEQHHIWEIPQGNEYLKGYRGQLC